MNNFNDKIPLAYFITFRTYASWLHGDERTSISRKHNVYNSPKINPNKNLKKQMQALQKSPSIIFTREQGDIILDAAVETCNEHGWRLHALHIRSNHVHFTVKAEDEPEHVLIKIKSRATFLLRKNGAFPKEQKIWSRHGSTKYLWSPESLYYSSEYTTERQGQKMAYFYNL